MFKDVTVLIAISDLSARRRVYDSVAALSFTGVQASTVSETLSHIVGDPLDILLLDEELINGSADVVMSHWMRYRGGPIAILARDYSLANDENLLGKGAWNVLTLKERSPGELMVDPAVLNTALVRYAQITKAFRAGEENKTLIAAMQKTTRRLWVAVLTLSILFAAYAGPDAILQIQKVLGGLL